MFHSLRFCFCAVHVWKQERVSDGTGRFSERKMQACFWGRGDGILLLLFNKEEDEEQAE
jgi:hypothetical protein